ncbi:MAG: diguanylate cyclase [Sulfurimonas sp.]|nr:diguanylate cyclase [Sulfurimonas sp.]
MKHSIAKIFSNLNTYLLFILFIALVGTFLIIEQKISFSKVNNLENQKKVLTSLLTLNIDDINLALIQLNGKDVLLTSEIEKLYSINQYNFTEKFFLGHEEEYLVDLNDLENATKVFLKDANFYYTMHVNAVLFGNIETLEVQAKAKMQASFDLLNNHINTMLIKNINYDVQKFNIIENLALVSLVIILIATLWYRKRLNSIYEDISFLYTIKTQKSDHVIFTQEMDAIALRMNRKVSVSSNPEFTDQLTGINNFKGMLTSYRQKKGIKDQNYLSVTLLSIDNISQTDTIYSQDLIHSILKKVAFSLSLYEQPTDVIARIDENLFVLIFSRSSKELCFKDIEKVHQSLSEIKISTPDQGIVHISVSAGFAVKQNKAHLEETIKVSKGILEFAQSSGGNKIYQIKDVANRNL